jgi:ATP-dependent DNA helicase RecQ
MSTDKKDIKEAVREFASTCASIDLEVSKKTNQILEIGAARHNSGNAPGTDGNSDTLHLASSNIPSGLNRLDAFCRDSQFLVGHNIIEFDLQHLVAVSPRLKLHGMPALDTLWLNPLAFPKNPYHHLVKHYQDGQLLSGQLNNPVADAQLALTLLTEQYTAISEVSNQSPELVLAWHWLTSVGDGAQGFERLFSSIRNSGKPDTAEAQNALKKLLNDKACTTFAQKFIEQAQDQDRKSCWALAYALAWIHVSGGSSVMPPWVRHQFPQASEIVRQLRDIPCDSPVCAWCASRHDAVKELTSWFPNHTQFRPTPTDESGRPLQRVIVEAAMRSEHVLGILPTGAGKSVCYQLPALSRFFKTGALTIVISPLVALMADQVNGLLNQGISSCAAISGLLSMPERKDVLERIRLGDIAILLLSPEQLRNRTVRKALEQREIGSWVLDEAHCVSKWGHDFRPDYRYVSRFIKEKAVDGRIPPILCLTATAKPDVVEDMVHHFREKVGIELKVFNGGTNRTNLAFEVIPTTPQEKLAHIHQVLMHELPLDCPGGAIIYCATRKKTAEIAQFLKMGNIAADYFHGALTPQVKKDVQERFIGGQLRVICATNAFGMGIDKPDVRLVIHADIPGSLENYLQEAGRAGRDRAEAKCVLMYTPEDVERQFGMSARSRLDARDIQAVLKSIRRLDRKKRLEGEVVATPGEILREDDDAEFMSSEDKGTDDTRVKTAVSWLEEAELLQRDENIVNVFPSSLRVRTIEEAKEKLNKAPQLVNPSALLAIVSTLIAADPDQGISTDELMGVTGLSQEFIRKAMHDLERLNICSNDMAITAFVNVGVQNSSSKVLQDCAALEDAIIDALRQMAPDMTPGETHDLNVRFLTQHIKDEADGFSKIHPDIVMRLLRGLADDGRRDRNAGTIRLVRRGEHFRLTLQTDWSELSKKARQRKVAAGLLLSHFAGKLGQNARGVDLLAQTTAGELEHAISHDIQLGQEVNDVGQLTERALLWLHEQQVIQINKGMAVFRSAMTIRLGKDKRGFTKSDFTPLKIHYDEQVVQIHVMSEYAILGREKMAEAMRLAMDYFRLPKDEFIKLWLPDRGSELSRQTSPDSWRKIVEDLGNTVQKRIVADDREGTSVLVLAGPGSGKTRVLVHRIAYLLRVRRESPHGILALAYNRHAAVEIRQRLRDLIGEDAKGVLVMTCHAMAMRLVGVSFAGTGRSRANIDFNQVLRDAVNLLKGDGLAPDEADDQRERLLAGFRWILVDEYQDVASDQYDLIAALAGRTLQDKENRLSLFAVGDDDQNIYAFNGASVEFIRRFEFDYEAKPYYLIENYRSSTHIIHASNAMIAPAKQRMKSDYPIVINKARQKLPAGGDLARLDPVAAGRVQLLRVTPGQTASQLQALAVIDELVRLSKLSPAWRWERAAVIARNWEFLSPVRAYCESLGIPVQMGDEDFGSVWRLRETQETVEKVRQSGSDLVDLQELKDWLHNRPTSPWRDLLSDGLEAYRLESGFKKAPPNLFIDWLAEWGQDLRRKQSGLLLLTAHSAKGLEFDHVAILDGRWLSHDGNPEPDEARRLFYVAMTRAKTSLTIAGIGRHPFERELASTEAVLQRVVNAPAELPDGVCHRYVLAQLTQVDIGYAGRHAPGRPVHRNIATLQPGSPLQLHHNGSKFTLLDGSGNEVGSMARAFNAPVGLQCIRASVYALHTRWKTDVAQQYLEATMSDVWEVVIPELVFA